MWPTLEGDFSVTSKNTLSAASYTGAAASANGEGGYDALICSNVVAKYSYKVKSGKKTVTKTLTRTLALAVSQGELGGVVALEENDGVSIEAWQNLWGSITSMQSTS